MAKLPPATHRLFAIDLSVVAADVSKAGSDLLQLAFANAYRWYGVSGPASYTLGALPVKRFLYFWPDRDLTVSDVDPSPDCKLVDLGEATDLVRGTIEDYEDEPEKANLVDIDLKIEAENGRVLFSFPIDDLENIVNAAREATRKMDGVDGVDERWGSIGYDK